MTTEQLESVIAATGHDRFRWLTSGANPDPVSREGYRRLVVARAEAVAADPSAYPPLATQAANLAGSLRDWLRAGLPITPRAERARRLAICEACPLFDAAARRCTACGCFGDVKPWLGTATCPHGKWDRDPPPPEE